MEKVYHEKKWINRLINFFIFLFASLTGLYFTTKKFNQTQLDQITEFISKPENNIDAKIDYISKYIASGNHNFFILKSILYIIILVIIAVFLGVLVSELADNKEKSFLVLTKKAKDEKDKHIIKRKRKTLLFFLSIIATILINILSSYIFQYINL